MPERSRALLPWRRSLPCASGAGHYRSGGSASLKLGEAFVHLLLILDVDLGVGDGLSVLDLFDHDVVEPCLAFAFDQDADAVADAK